VTPEERAREIAQAILMPPKSMSVGLVPSGPVNKAAELIATAIREARNAALDEAAAMANALADRWAEEWREGLKASTYLEGNSDGAEVVAARILALKDKPE
jgi:hypothetical protein